MIGIFEHSLWGPTCQPHSQGLSSYCWGGKMRDPGNDITYFHVNLSGGLKIFHFEDYEVIA